jgi:hypothetical protein
MADEIRVLTMWATPLSGNLIHVAFCPECGAMVPVESWELHTGWHAKALRR